ncbi:MAG: alpha/beta hydrolase [Bacteroidetes bacterium]|nr:alpha/beta hydrolase [Bacteroidota bacterium]MBU1116774.1 alpha/beta hydrolase [Bacteroidota bacterium]MBU1798837.1 alpha/beta hydrolase [Bacteroidota bacterium]
MKSIINDLAVYTSGNSQNQSIIFVHGFPYDHSMWDKQVEYLSQNYFCITYDIRGLGASVVGDGQYTMEKYAEDLFMIISELNLSKPILCGLSMGGYLSFRAVEINQNIFKSVIFCDTKAQSDTDEIKLIRANKIKQINEDGLDAFVEGFVPTCFSSGYKTNYSDNYQSIKTLCKTNKPIGVKGALIAMLSRVDSTPFLSKISIPTLHLCGEFDEMTPPNLMAEVASKITNSHFFVVPNSGHMSPIENPDFVNKAIYDFIKQL